MGSDNIPEIDLSELKPTSGEWETARSQVWKAMEEYGSFRAVFRKVPLELPNSIFNVQKELFDLPLETKLKFNDDICELPFGGYIGCTPFTPIFESFGLEDPLSFQVAQKRITALLPHASDFCKNVHEFSKQILELESMILRMVIESLGINNYLDEQLNSLCHSFRLQKYDSTQKSKAEIAFHSHKDKDLITILYQNQVDGLEFQTRDGNWVACKASPHNFIVLFGESLYAWTNGRVYAPNHRVTIKEKKLRYSIGLFTAFKKGYLIKAPEELVDEEHPLLYKPFDFSEVLELEKRDAAANLTYVPLGTYFGIDV